MKIAIQGHPTRGKEVIQILESLGGVNPYNHIGNNCCCYYEIHGNTIVCACTKSDNYKHYTLEEFEEEFPFKIGDKVIYDYTPNFVGTIVDIKFDDNIPYRVDIKGTICTCGTNMLKLYKEMQERNITLTLDKAKEWYKKGGELKEVALQAYSEEELTKVELPKTWEEFCENYPIKTGEFYIDTFSEIHKYSESDESRDIEMDKNICPSKESAEAHLAMIQLEQLRNYYNDNSDAWGWSYSIVKRNGIPELVRGCDHSTFLRFKNETIAKQFLKNFKDLIDKADDLI